MRILFLGSPVYVVPVLERLNQLEGSHLVGVISQPPRPVGRHRSTLEDPPVAAYAKHRDLLVLQPANINELDSLAAIRALKPDLAITAAYGQILSQAFLEIFPRGTINIHPSLLPKYRGATPIPSALLAGDRVTGVSILFTVRKLDAGNLICQNRVNIQSEETAMDLYDRLFKVGADMLPQALLLLADNSFRGDAQNPEEVTHCGKIAKEDGQVDWLSPCGSIYNRYRAFCPWPGSFTFLENNRLQIIRMSLPSHEKMRLADPAGSFVYDEASLAFRVKCGTGEIQIEQVKPAGKNVLTAKEFYHGLRNKDARFHRSGE